MAKGCCGRACSCCRKKGAAEDPSHYRNIQFNHYDATKAKNNRISTCKYTWWNFPFKFLLEQYQRPNNIFFLVVFISNCFPSLRIVTIGTLLTPIIFILVIGAIREIIEDVARAKADKLANSTQYTVIRQGKVSDIISANVCQGDLLILRDGDEVPADCLLLYSHLISKIAYVNTASLDGESNLKPRTAIFEHELTSLTEKQCISLMQTVWGRISVYPPNSNLSLFTGKVSYTKGTTPALDQLLSPTNDPAYTPARQSLAGLWRRNGIFDGQLSPESTPTPAVASLKPEPHKSEPDSVLVETSTLPSDDVIDPDVGSVTPTSGIVNGIRGCISHDSYATGAQTLFMATISTVEKNKHLVSTQDLRAGQGVADTPNKQRARIVHFSTDNTLLRGMRLQNTPFAIGIVIYTGYETRLMMNQIQTHRKSSRVQQRLDRVLLLEILLMVIGLFICGGIAAGKNDSYVQYYNYAGFTKEGHFTVFLKRVMVFIVLFSYSLPISLFVTLEISHLLQGIMIELDPKLRLPELVSCLKADSENPLPPAKVQGLVKSSMLVEDMAEVDIIFSDKTGTLTRNEMVFHSYFTLPGGIRCVYDQITKTMTNANDAEVTHAWLSFLSLEETTAVEDSISLAVLFALGLCNTIITFSNNGKIVYQGESPDEVAFAQAAATFGLQLIERQADIVIYKYKVPLPKMDQFLPMGLDLELRYRFPIVVPFTSTRKRMSIVLEEEGNDVPSVLLPLLEPYLSTGSPLPSPSPDLVVFNGFTYNRRTRKIYCTPLLLAETPGSPFLLCKGADTFLLPLCRPIGGSLPLEVPTINAAIDRFSCEGLRTLAWATRQPHPEFMEQFLKTWPAISIKPEGDVEYQKHTAMLETDLSFLGATAIEDRLASLVPETLATLVGGGLKVWMLTGDKTQTAVNIARSSNLSPYDAQWLFLTIDNVYRKNEEIQRGEAMPVALPSFVSQKANSEKLVALFTLLKEFEMEISSARTVSGTKPTRRSSPTSANLQGSNQIGSPEVKTTGLKKFASTIKNAFSFTDLYQKKQDYRTTTPFTTVIDSEVFKLIYQSGLHDFLLSITLHSTAVVCCRLSPEEKALIVTLTRNCDKQLTTLAIGDGANDCPMIKAAHIGVGIAGREGLHASNVSDFSIPEFRFLRRLLFVHGHYTHFRNSELIEYSIYKNIIITLLCGIYTGQSLFSAVMILNDKMLMMYNILLTFIPILVYSLCEKDIKDRVLELHPTVFRVFERKPEMNFRSIGLRISVAVYQAIVLYLWSWHGMASTLTTQDGYAADFSVFGYYLLFELICTVTVTFCIHIFMWTWLTFAAVLISLLCFIILIILANYTLFFTDTLYSIPAFTARSLNFWVVVTGAVATATLPVLFYNLTVTLYRPWSYHLLHYQYRHQLRDCCGRVLDTAGDVTRAERYDECLAKVQTLMARNEPPMEAA